MKKIPTIFERDWEDPKRPLLNQPTVGCEWVFDGEGLATRKYDGIPCLVSAGKLFTRRELKPGDETPIGWRPVSFDGETQKEIGWIPVGDGPEHKYLREAFANLLKEVGEGNPTENGTYEAVGPKIQGGVEGYEEHTLIRHDLIGEYDTNVPVEFNALKAYLTLHNSIEGIVWHHEDGRMAKIKLKDFGIKRK